VSDVKEPSAAATEDRIGAGLALMPSLIRLVEVRAAIAFAGLLALAALATACHLGVTTGLLAYLGACCAAALSLTVGYAALVAGSGWACLTGFVVNHTGALTFHQPDLQHLALLMATALVLASAHQRRHRA
jgi:uncharacterized membrane protein